MLIIIDNYDSFTYNLVQYFGDLDMDTHVYRNDKIEVQDLVAMNPKGIVISPGPSNPDRAGISLDVVNACLENNMPLLGVCLGHQAIGQAMGGKIVKTPPVHGKTDTVKHTNEGVFRDLENPLEVTRYHSLIIDQKSLPSDLMITAENKDGIIMGIKHKNKNIQGVQFHPESIATKSGHNILKNFIESI